jgi:hypothetical protein
VVTGAGRDPDAVAVLLDVTADGPDPVEAVRAGAADGVTLLGGPDTALVARFDELGLRRPVAVSATLRERFGLPRPANFFAEAHR